MVLGRQLLAALEQRRVEGVVDAESAVALGCEAGPPRADLGKMVDLVFVLGGDGTFLSVARGCPTSTPIAGVNLGSLGFLTEHAPDHTFSLLDEIMAGQVEIESRDRLCVTVGDGTGEKAAPVLNDVVVTNATLARILTLRVEVDGDFLSTYRADGLILSSPTGSTAYNLSAGGPIIHPALPALLITPICAHTLTNRPLVVPPSVTVRVRVERGYDSVLVTLDGQVAFPLPVGTAVVVEPSEQPLSFVRNVAGSFFGVLHRKLKWGERES